MSRSLASTFPRRPFLLVALTATIGLALSAGSVAFADAGGRQVSTPRAPVQPDSTQPDSTQPDSTDDVETAFARGNDAYARGDYREAVRAYRSVLNAGSTSVALYHNLGNAHYRLEENGQAIRYYELARRLQPGDPALAHNLARVRDRIPGAARHPVVTRWTQTLDALPVTGLYVAGVLLLTGGWVVAVVRTGTLAGVLRDVPGGLLSLAGVLGIGLALAVSGGRAQRSQGVILTDRAPVHRSPDADAPADTTLREGMMVDLRSRSGSAADWQRVRLADGTAGWVRADAVTPIPLETP